MKNAPMGRTKNEILVGGFNAVNELFTEEIDFKYIADNGVDFILMTYLHDEKSEWNVRMMEKYGVKAFFYDTILNGSDPRTLTDDVIREASAPYINSPAFLGFGIIDEPSDPVFPRLGAEVDAIKRVYPDALFHINLLPWYAFNDTKRFYQYLNGFANYVDINHISTDDYPLWRNPEDGTLSTSNVYYLGVNCSAEVARDHEREHWGYIYSFSGTAERGYRIFTENDLSFQAFSMMTFGVSKFLYFCFDVTGYKGKPNDAPGLPFCMRDYNRGKTELFDYSKRLNVKLHALSDVFCKYTWRKTGAVLCDGKNEGFLKGIAPYDFDRMKEIKSNVGIAVGYFEETDANGEAFMLMNASEVSEGITAEVSFKLPYDKKVTVYMNSAAASLKPDQNGVYTVSIAPGMGAFITAKR